VRRVFPAARAGRRFPRHSCCCTLIYVPDFDDLDDWSETEEWDSSDTWDDAEGWNEDDEDEEAEDELDWDDDAAEDDWGDAEHVGGGVGAVHREQPVAAERRGVSAMEFGLGVAVAGWLLDAHAEKIVEGVRAAAPAVQQAQPAWQRLDGVGFDQNATAVRPGETLNRSGLHRVLSDHLGRGQDLVIDARPVVDRGAPRPGSSLDWSALRFTILHSPLVDSLPLWVLFDERAGGFNSAWLLPVFADVGPPGRAYCYVDTPARAVHVVEWGLGRHALTLDQFRWQAR
jgi:hypothetical protein